MNVAVVQLCSTQDIDANMRVIERLVTEAAAAGARLVAIPENAAYLQFDPDAKTPIQPLDGPIVSRFKALAGGLGIWLLVGSYPETCPSPELYHNTSVLIDGTAGDGTARVAATYRKMHLFDIDIVGRESHRESDTISAGDEIVCSEVDGRPIGLTICYDLRFPALYQALMKLNARIITVPSAFTEFTGKDHWLPLLRARAIETQAFVVAPNQWGYHGGKRKSYGKSVIIDPWGIPMCTVSDGVGWAMARLDFEAQDRIRAAMPCLQHRHPAV